MLLLIILGLALTSARVKSATFDEDAYVGKGAAIWFRGTFGLRTAHPALAPILGTAPLLTEPGFAEATDFHKCEEGNARGCGRELLFRRSDTRRVLFLVRLPTVGLLVVLAALVYGWAREMYGPWGGLLALVVFAFEPNLLAHGRLLTLDLPATTFLFLTLYTAWRYWREPTWWRLIAWGVALGLAAATRYTLGFVVPVLAAAALIPALRPGGRPDGPKRPLPALLALAAAGAVAALTVWAVYGFTFGPVPDWEVRLPAPAYFYDLKELLAYRSKPQDAFLWGRHYTGGWWPYFLVTLAVKTPLPVLVLGGAALVSLMRRRRIRRGEGLILLTGGLYYGLSLFSPFNIGHRHLLPLLPLLAVFVGRLGPRLAAGRRAGRVAAGALAIWLALGTLHIHPHYLAYFNELVGPRNGYRVLVDSNLDWGQDLPALERYVAERGIERGVEMERLYLSWFGESRPDQYRIPHRFIPSKPDQLSDIFTRVYHPDYPLPGTYAISATNLQGLLFDDQELFDWFRRREPVARPGYSILIYEVPRLLDPDAPAVNVALGSKQIDQVPSTIFEEQWRTNDLQLRWFEAGQSCILAAQGETWYVVDAEARDALSLCPFWDGAVAPLHVPVRAGDGTLRLSIEHLRVSPEAREAWLSTLTGDSPLILSDEVAFEPGEAAQRRHQVRPPLRFGDRLDLLGYGASSDVLRPGSEWRMVTYWRVAADGGVPLKVFAQLLDDAGNARAQYDGFDVPVIGWREGDLLAQRQTLSVPGDLSPGRYWVQFGVYEGWTLERLPVLLDGERVGTRLLLPPLEVE